MLLRLLFGVGLWGSALATALGLIAPLIPHFELINQFRPYLLLGAIAVVVLGLATSARPTRLAMAVAGVNLLLFLIPLTMMAHGPADAAAGERVGIVAFNLQDSRQHQEIEAFLAQEDPDIVIFEELRVHHAEQLMPSLKGRYPHQIICESCGMAVLTKTPLTSVSESEMGRWVSGLWTSPQGKVQRIVGLHVSWPFGPRGQKADVDELIGALRGWKEPMIVAGDFNLGPWTWKLNKITWTTGLRRHGTFALSWPVYAWQAAKHSLPDLPVPSFVLIDNVLTSPEISGESFASGPDLGSDHRAVIARLRLP